jgi:hypothetical protein
LSVSVLILIRRLFHLDDDVQVEAIHSLVATVKDEIAHAARFVWLACYYFIIIIIFWICVIFTDSQALQHESDVLYLNGRVLAYEEQAERFVLQQKINKMQTPTPDRIKAMLKGAKEEMGPSKAKNNAKWHLSMGRATREREDRERQPAIDPGTRSFPILFLVFLLLFISSDFVLFSINSFFCFLTCQTKRTRRTATACPAALAAS